MMEIMCKGKKRRETQKEGERYSKDTVSRQGNKAGLWEKEAK